MKGFEIKLIGDAYMVAFRTADAALQFAMDFRRDTGDPRITIRVGIHVGQVRIKDEDIYGLMVNYAARLQHALAIEGIYVSDFAKREIESEYGTEQKDFQCWRLPTKLPSFGEDEVIWQILTPEIRQGRRARRRAQLEEEARKNAKPAVSPRVRVPDPPPTNTLIPVYKPQRVKLPDPPTITLRPRYKPESKTLDGIMRCLTHPPTRRTKRGFVRVPHSILCKSSTEGETKEPPAGKWQTVFV